MSKELPSGFPSITFWNRPDTYRQVCTNKEWRSYILGCGSTFVMAAGHSYNWKSKPIGGGLREVWMEPKHMNGCTILRCSHYVGERCTYPGNVCKYRLGEPMALYDDLRGRLKIACDALVDVSEVGTSLVDGDEEMKDISDSALRRLSLNNPQ